MLNDGDQENSHARWRMKKTLIIDTTLPQYGTFALCIITTTSSRKPLAEGSIPDDPSFRPPSPPPLRSLPTTSSRKPLAQGLYPVRRPISIVYLLSPPYSGFRHNKSGSRFNLVTKFLVRVTPHYPATHISPLSGPSYPPSPAPHGGGRRRKPPYCPHGPTLGPGENEFTLSPCRLDTAGPHSPPSPSWRQRAPAKRSWTPIRPAPAPVPPAPKVPSRDNFVPIWPRPIGRPNG